MNSLDTFKLVYIHLSFLTKPISQDMFRRTLQISKKALIFQNGEISKTNNRSVNRPAGTIVCMQSIQTR